MLVKLLSFVLLQTPLARERKHFYWSKYLCFSLAMVNNPILLLN